MYFEVEVDSESDLVVLILMDGSQKKDWGWDVSQLDNTLWLADPLNVDG